MAFAEPTDFGDLWAAHCNSGDLGALMGLYDEDVRAVLEPGVSVVGRAALREAMAGSLAMRPARFTHLGSTAVQAGDLAVLYAGWTAELTGPDGPVSRSGNAVLVLRRIPAGWSAVIDDFQGRG